MKRILSFLILLTVCTLASAQKQKAMDYYKAWKYVEKLQEQRQPKSAAEAVTDILRTATAAGHVGQTFKAALSLTALREELSPDSLEADVPRLEALGAKCRDAADRALWHALMASVYDVWRDQGSWSQRDETSEEELRQKADQHRDSVLVDMDALAGTPLSADLGPLYESGKDSERLMANDVLSLVWRHGVKRDEDDDTDEADALRVLTAMERLYTARGMRDAVVLCQLEALRMRNRMDSGAQRLSDKRYAAALRDLYLKNRDTEAGADACLRYMQAAHLSYSALDSLAAEALQTWKGSPLANNFKNEQAQAHEPELTVTSNNNMAVANEPFAVVVRHRNLDRCVLRVTHRTRGTMENRTLTFDASDLDFTSDTIKLTLPPGHYTVMAEAGGKKEEAEFDLSRLRLIGLIVATGARYAIVVDAMTGQPVEGAEVDAKWSERVGNKWVDRAETVTTDAEGRALLPTKTSKIVARKGDDVSVEVSVYAGFGSGRAADEQVQTHYQVYTDRAIYRPGQTLHLSGLVYRQTGDETLAQADESVEAVLRDANYKEVGRQTLRTDEWGMAACDFTLPTDRLLGRYTLQFGQARYAVSVEEYKRPTFEVTFQPLEGQFALGDTVTLRGEAKTYSGVPVTDATVSYRIQRSESSFFRWWRYHEKEMDQGQLTTDEQGRFAIDLCLDDDSFSQDDDDDDEAVAAELSDIFNFRVTAQVTDLAGESHDAETTVRVGRIAFGLEAEGPDNIDVAVTPQATFSVAAANANRQHVAAAGRWTLLGWNATTRAYDRPCAEGQWTTADSTISIPASALPLGSLRLTLETTDSAGHAIEAQHDFVAWNSDDLTTPLALKEAFLCQSAKEVDAKSGVDFFFAPADADAYTYIYMQTADSVLRSTLSVLQPTLHRLHLDYEPWMGDGIELTAFYAHQGGVVRQSASVVLRRPDKALKMEWQTFRDRLQPGQQETWTLRVTHADGTPARAEVLAAMYDASLDALTSHSWPLSLQFDRRMPSLHWNMLVGDANFHFSLPLTGPSRVSYYERSWNSLRLYGDYSASLLTLREERLFSGVSRRRGAPMLMMARAAANVESAEEASVMSDSALPLAASKATASGSAKKSHAAEPQLRENFAETAFFFPALLTDAQGNVQIRFTLPESLTEWKVMTLAHTKAIDYGTLEATAQARKDFMVQPQMPRFVREGDRLTLATRLINQSETAVTGTVVMTLTDAATGREVSAQKQTFTLAAGETRAATFAYDVPEDAAGLLVCEVSGRSDRFSDGERNYLPVLSSRKTIYETLPFYLTGAEEKTIDLEPLFNHHSATATHRALTIDYTDNPSWTAVMALHTIALPATANTNAMAWSAALYANSVAQSLAARMPRLQALIQSWKSETGTDKTLDSELQKNQELKEILLQESPWMLDADRETEERNQLVELFDQNLLAQRIGKAQEQLARLQYADGGWAWMDGMEPNYYVTLTVSEHLARLAAYLDRHALPQGSALDAASVQKMLSNGITYLDKKEAERYKKYYRKDRDLLPAETSCRYLYLKTLAGKTEDSGSVATLTDDYLGRVEKHMSQLSMYGQANMAVVLLRHERTESARAFVRSLREYMVEKPGMGRYFDTRHALYSWLDYRIPTHVAAMRAVQATASLFEGDTKSLLLDMQLWLLRQKQAQKWDNEVTTLDVCDLLLSVDSAATFHEAQPPVVRLDGKRLTLPTPSAGTGYVKVAAEGKAIDAATLTVRKQSEGVSWGCAYGRSLERLDRVEEASSGELHVSRTLYRRAPQADGTTGWTPLADGEELAVGDRVKMRLRVEADRDMDFLQLSCQHAACMEPVNQLSGYQHLGGRGAYLAHHDSRSDVFFDWFLKGSATVDLEFYVTRAGRYSQGIVTLQSAYCPAFSARSAGSSVSVTEAAAQ